MAQDYWITKKRLNERKYYVVEYTDEDGDKMIRQGGSGPLTTLKGAQRALEIVRARNGYKDAKIIEYIGEWRELKE